MGEKISFEPIPVTFSSFSDSFVSENCISRGLYCTMKPAIRSGVNGRDVIFEAIRQKCAYNVGIKEFFAYIKQFYKLCSNSFTAECSMQAAKAAEVDFALIDKCVNESFDRDFPNLIDNDNKLLAIEKAKYKLLNVSKFPEIYINKNLYRGTLSYFDLVLSLCSTLNDQTSRCKHLNFDAKYDLDMSKVLAVSFLIFAIGVLILVVVCKRMAKKRYMRFSNQRAEQSRRQIRRRVLFLPDRKLQHVSRNYLFDFLSFFEERV